MAMSTARPSTGDRAAPESWTENRPSGRWSLGLNLGEFWSHRELAFFLALRDFKLRYTQSMLGVAWVLVQPMAGAAIFYGVFGRGLSIPSDGIPYLVFAYAGLVVWSYVSVSVQAAAESLAGHSGLVTKVYFPRLVAPVAAALPGLIDFAIALVVLALLMAINDVAPSAALLTLPVWILAALGVALAVGIWLAALNAQYRDVRYALGFFMQLWFFASPIVYSSAVVSGAWKYLFAANPLVGVIDGFRWSVLDGPAPGSQDLVSLGVGMLILITGLAYFRGVERRLADVI
jgi:lipopolysaccharide transport system permease protein